MTIAETRGGMNMVVKWVALTFFSFLLITQFQNCSSSSDNTLFQSSNLPSVTSGISDPTKPSIQLSTLVSPLNAEPSDNQISVSGSCNPAGRIYNYIQYSVVEAVSKRQLNLSVGPSPVYSLRDAICENGKFYIIEVNDNPNIDAGTEDKVLKEKLYDAIMEVILNRIKATK
jgi:hypothetical protein